LWTDCIQEEGRILSRSDFPKEENHALVAHAKKRKGGKFPYQKKKGKRQDFAKGHKPRDMSKVKCYNCQKFGHFATNFPEPSKKKGNNMLQ
jgi:hypothetical protein